MTGVSSWWSWWLAPQQDWSKPAIALAIGIWPKSNKGSMKVYWESFGKGLLASEKQNNTQKRDCSCHSSGCYYFWACFFFFFFLTWGGGETRMLGHWPHISHPRESDLTGVEGIRNFKAPWRLYAWQSWKTCELGVFAGRLIYWTCSRYWMPWIMVTVLSWRCFPGNCKKKICLSVEYNFFLLFCFFAAVWVISLLRKPR